MSPLPASLGPAAPGPASPPAAPPLPSLAEVWDADFSALAPWQWAALALVFVTALGVALLVERVLLALGSRLAKLTAFKWDDQLVQAGRGPLRLCLGAALLAAGTRALRLPVGALHPLDLVVRSLVIVSVAWFVQRCVGLLGAYLEERVDQEAGNDPSRARGMRTQMVVLRHFTEAATFVVGAALLLLQFDVVRNVGVSLLASAGIAGLVLGLAAQKSISTLLAGIQLSITQPIRIGDSVVMEGESGTIEEITLTYVVVRLWNLRRVVVPITWFLDKPFQNWSKGQPELLGTVLLEVDYAAEVDAFRGELQRVLASPEGKALWNGKMAKVAVIEAGDKTKTLRVLLSAADADKIFDLRCLVREKLTDFLAAHPAWLPVARSEAVTRPPRTGTGGT